MLNLFLCRVEIALCPIFPCSTYYEGKCSSAASNSVYGQIAKSPENGGSKFSDGGEIADFVESNGKLETFKDLTI